MGRSIEELVHDLEREGIVPPNSEKNVKPQVNVNNREIEIINFMENTNNLKFSDEQRKILMHHGNMVILACAGSGKTSISINLIAKRILNGEIKDTKKLIYTTYSKAGQLEMKDRLNKLFKGLGIRSTVEVRTLHSFFLQILRTFGVQSDIISEADRLRIIKKAAQDVDLKLQGDDLATLNNLLSYQVNNLMSDAKAMESSANTLDNMTSDQYTTIRQTYAAEKAKANKIDYDDMMSYLYLWIVRWKKSTNPNEYNLYKQVLYYCKSLYDYFIIDEAQDTSLLQFSIVKALVTDENDATKLDKEFIYIGDDDQAIYSWRGSDPSIILTVGTQFNIPTYVLSTNYRCKSSIVDYATVGIKCNSSRFNKGMSAFSEGGTVKIYTSAKKDLCNLSIIAMNQIKYWLSEGHDIRNIAVLSRNNFHLAILNNMLMRSGIYSDISNDMKLTKSTMYQDIKGCIELAGALSDNGECYKSSLTAQMMWHLCPFLGVANSNKLAKFQDSCGLSFKDLTGYLTKTFIDPNNCNFNKKLVGIGTAEFSDINRVMMRFAFETKNAIKEIYNSLCSDDINNRIVGMMAIYRTGSTFFYKTPDKARSIDGLIGYIKQLLIKDGVDSMLSFLRVSEQLESGNMIIDDDKLTLTTIHSAKGREWRDVIMFACDNITEPGLDYIKQLKDNDMDIKDLNNYIDEERRLFYVGNTRAKENLFVITYEIPSIFILENLGAFNIGADGNNSKVLRIADNKQLIQGYLDEYNRDVIKSDGKYHYNPDDYKVKEITEF